MDIYKLLADYWGYGAFRPLQEDIIRSVLAGRDTLALMPTGGGKSITYQVPGLAMEGVCVVISPLIALMKDQVEELKRRGIAAEAVYTGMAPEYVDSYINKAVAGKVKFLYVSPERLVSARFRERLKLMKVSLLAVDEAHCISQWGYDFRPSYLQIAEVRTFFPGVPVLALTATATPQVAGDIQRRLGFAEPHVFSKSFRRENLAYVVRKSGDKPKDLVHILSSVPGSAIVYVRLRAKAEEVAALLVRNGIRADFYHAGLSYEARNLKQEAWKRGETPVIVATNAFGMGIDKPDVRLVVHFNLPDSPETYFQEVGRAGRDGKKAYAVLLYSEGAVARLKRRITDNFPARKYVRKVYRQLGNFFQVEEGSGEGCAFEFSPEAFRERSKLEGPAVDSALRILQLAGYVECTTDVHARSQIRFLVLRDQLYRIELYDGLAERLVEHLLRKYAGIFVKYATVDEGHIACDLGVGREEVYKTLLDLARRKIVSYIPGNSRPYIVYLQPRVPDSYLHIGTEVYEERKQSYAEKVMKMVEYIHSEGVCRQVFLMDYFGQKESAPCGKCDCCLEQKKKGKQTDRWQTMQAILERLGEAEQEPGQLAKSLKEEREYVLECVRLLLEEGRIVYTELNKLALKR